MDAITWEMPLESRPALLVMGTGRHGQTRIERYQLRDVWCIHLYHYRGILRVRGHEFPIRPGYVSLTPPFITLEHQFDEPDCLHRVGHFSLPAGAGVVSAPAMQDLGYGFNAFEVSFVEAIGWFSTQPRRAEARVWDLLWRLTPPAPAAGPLHHPAVRRTLETIEVRLGECLSVADLAREVDLTHGHLSRLFRQEMGKTVVGYIRERRVERARHLLTYSSLPIKSVAAQVGISDLHLFNKVLRRETGQSPRGLRGREAEKMAARE